MSTRAVGWGVLGSGAALAVVGLALIVTAPDGSTTATPTTLAAPAGTIATTTTATSPRAIEPAPTAASGTTTPPTSTTTTTTLSPTTVDPLGVVTTFFDDLSAAIRNRDVGFLAGHLHPVVFDRYDAAACDAYFRGLEAPGFAIEVSALGSVGPWDWTTDDLTRTIDGVTAVEIQRTADGSTFTEAESHVVVDVGDVAWFTDCGTPKEGAA